MIPTSRFGRPFVVFLLPVFLAAAAYAQIKPFRIKVDKISKKNTTKTVYQDASGAYRNQQVNETVHYHIEVVNFSTMPRPDVKIKWVLLYDSSQATVQGNGGINAPAPNLKTLEGERTCSLAVGQKYIFDTESLNLSSVSSSMPYTTKLSHQGGEVLGYVVEVLVGDALAAKEISPPDTKSRIEKLKASQTEDN
jgi:hypothetical protein